MKNLAVGCAALIAALASTSASAAPIFAINAAGRLVTFDSAAPGTVTSTTVLSGIVGGAILGIDFRPSTGQLYAIGGNGQLYTINTATGAATTVGAGGIPLVGSNFGFNFNPTVDRIRFVSEAGSNYRLNPDTGGIAATDTPYTYTGGGTPTISTVSYTNSGGVATTTTLYGIDYTLNTLALINNPNGGLITTVGSLGFDVDADSSLDIASDGTAYLSAGTNFYTVNLVTGAATLVSATGGYRFITVRTAVPEPASWALMIVGFGAVGYGMRRRSKVTVRTSFAA